MSLRQYKTINERREYLGKVTGQTFTAIKAYPEALDEAQYKNCENMIGAVCLPLGIAGPLKISGEYANNDYYIPLATTEAALVASVNRGCKAITKSGGAKVRTSLAGITRGAVFKTKSLTHSLEFTKWLKQNMKRLSTIASGTSSHLSLMDIFTKVVGRNAYIRFSYDSQDAMGMNMVTIATDKIARFLEKDAHVTCISIAGNFDVDKKPSWLNFILGRGREVWAETTLDKENLKSVLKTTAQNIHVVAKEKCLIGSAISGSMGFNAHFANILAAIFIATGQDPAHVSEGSLGITTTEIDGESLYTSIYIPDLIIGTVGGGTTLPAQKEALSIIGVEGGGNGKKAFEFAEVIAGAVLAGEISLLASLSEGSLASTHRRLARP